MLFHLAAIPNHVYQKVSSSDLSGACFWENMVLTADVQAILEELFCKAMPLTSKESQIIYLEHFATESPCWADMRTNMKWKTTYSLFLLMQLLPLQAAWLLLSKRATKQRAIFQNSLIKSQFFFAQKVLHLFKKLSQFPHTTQLGRHMHSIFHFTLGKNTEPVIKKKINCNFIIFF